MEQAPIFTQDENVIGMFSRLNREDQEYIMSFQDDQRVSEIQKLFLKRWQEAILAKTEIAQNPAPIGIAVGTTDPLKPFIIIPGESSEDEFEIDSRNNNEG